MSSTNDDSSGSATQRVLPEQSYICPGSIFTPPKGWDRCMCGQPREGHMWAHDGRGGFIDVQAQS